MTSFIYSPHPVTCLLSNTSFRQTHLGLHRASCLAYAFFHGTQFKGRGLSIVAGKKMTSESRRGSLAGERHHSVYDSSDIICSFIHLASITHSWACPVLCHYHRPPSSFHTHPQFYLEESIPDLLIHEFKSTVPCGKTGILGVNTELQRLMSDGRGTKEDLIHRAQLPCCFSKA